VRNLKFFFSYRGRFEIFYSFSSVGGAAAVSICYRQQRRLENFYFFSSAGGAAAVFISYRRRGVSKIYK
jgi:hypothetical protein